MKLQKPLYKNKFVVSPVLAPPMLVAGLYCPFTEGLGSVGFVGSLKSIVSYGKSPSTFLFGFHSVIS